MTLQAQSFGGRQQAHGRQQDASAGDTLLSCHFVIGGHSFVAIAGATGIEHETRPLVGRITLASIDYRVYDADLIPTEVQLSAADILTRRELQIAMLIADGKCDKEIATKLGISGYTVREHIRRIFAKLKIGRRSAIVSYVMRQRPAQFDRGLGGPSAPA